MVPNIKRACVERAPEVMQQLTQREPPEIMRQRQAAETVLLPQLIKV